MQAESFLHNVTRTNGGGYGDENVVTVYDADGFGRGAQRPDSMSGDGISGVEDGFGCPEIYLMEVGWP